MLPTFHTYNLSSESIQIRAYQLTRELHVIAEEQAAPVRHILHVGNEQTTFIPQAASIPLKSDNHIIDLVVGDD